MDQKSKKMYCLRVIQPNKFPALGVVFLVSQFYQFSKQFLSEFPRLIFGFFHTFLLCCCYCKLVALTTNIVFDRKSTQIQRILLEFQTSVWSKDSVGIHQETEHPVIFLTLMHLVVFCSEAVVECCRKIWEASASICLLCSCRSCSVM